jgi:hypothetical protein
MRSRVSLHRAEKMGSSRPRGRVKGLFCEASASAVAPLFEGGEALGGADRSFEQPISTRPMSIEAALKGK